MISLKVFLVCFNEAELLPHTVRHYRKMVPSCDIVVNDNFSTDNSRDIARSLGCEVVDYESKGIIDDFKLRDLKNNCWKGSGYDWVVVCDMDEWICIDEESLSEEKGNGKTLIKTIGFDIIGNSLNADISDINPHECSNGVRNLHLDKSICFDPKSIKDINYNVGAHRCSPTGRVTASDGSYMIKHMNWLGLPYRLARNRIRFERSKKMRSMNLATHYINDDKILSSYFHRLKNASIDLKDKCNCFWDQ